MGSNPCRKISLLGIAHVTPQTRGSVDYPSTRGIQVEVGLPDATLENRAESPLYGELYPNTKPVNKPAFTCPKQSNIFNISNIFNPMSNTATWAHKLMLIKTHITTILQLSPNNYIVDFTFIQTYINIYKSNTCYAQKPSSHNRLLQNELSPRALLVPEIRGSHDGVS